MYLEREGEPPRGGFSGERGLAYAYVLAKRKYYRHALEQIEGLETSDGPYADSLVLHLIAGHVRERRRRYEDSFASYLRAATALTSEHSQSD